ncbi:hypothetical protein L3Y34_012131 [Caenorhabditis briggsae]|uniref:RING-type domain-containing protein n=1 Tax=Caenorhabditis briggsae TaxID=6238 RepID=A0AAE8ZTB5_CAEBR|nr:hypothetical protein L3Y34_012131 [Caenorhabditis briggsae]
MPRKKVNYKKGENRLAKLQKENARLRDQAESISMSILCQAVGAQMKYKEAQNDYNLFRTGQKSKNIYLRYVLLNRFMDEKSFFAEEALHILRIGPQHTKMRDDEKEREIQNFARQWKTQKEDESNCISLISEHTLKSALIDLNIYFSTITLVEDIDYRVMFNEHMSCFEKPIHYVDPKKKKVLTCGQAFYAIFIACCCGTNWNENVCSEHPDCKNDYQKLVIQIVSKYNGEHVSRTMFPFAMVQTEIEQLQRHCYFLAMKRANEKRAYAGRDYLFSDMKHDDQVGISSYKSVAEFYDLQYIQLDGGRVDAWIARFLLMAGWTKQFFAREKTSGQCLLIIMMPLLLEFIPYGCQDVAHDFIPNFINEKLTDANCKLKYSWDSLCPQKLMSFYKKGVVTARGEQPVDWQLELNKRILISNRSLLPDNLKYNSNVPFFVIDDAHQKAFVKHNDGTEKEMPKNYLLDYERYSETVSLVRHPLRFFPAKDADGSFVPYFLESEVKIMFRRIAINKETGISPLRYTDYKDKENPPEVLGIYNLDNLKQLCKYVDVDVIKIMFVPDLVMKQTAQHAISNPYTPVTTLGFHGEVVMNDDQAVIHTYIRVLCGVNWKVVSSSQHFEGFRLRFLYTMENYTKGDRKTIKTMKFVNRNIEHLLEHKLFEEHPRTSDRGFLYEEYKFDDTIPGAEHKRKSAELEVPYLSQNEDILPIWQARIYMISAYITLFCQHSRCNKICMYDELHFLEDGLLSKIPEEAREQQAKFMSIVRNIWSPTKSKALRVVRESLASACNQNEHICNNCNHNESISKEFEESAVENHTKTETEPNPKTMPNTQVVTQTKKEDPTPAPKLFSTVFTPRTSSKKSAQKSISLETASFHSEKDIPLICKAILTPEIRRFHKREIEMPMAVFNTFKKHQKMKMDFMKNEYSRNMKKFNEHSKAVEADKKIRPLRDDDLHEYKKSVAKYMSILDFNTDRLIRTHDDSELLRIPAVPKLSANLLNTLNSRIPPTELIEEIDLRMLCCVCYGLLRDRFTRCSRCSNKVHSTCGNNWTELKIKCGWCRTNEETKINCDIKNNQFSSHFVKSNIVISPSA